LYSMSTDAPAVPHGASPIAQAHLPATQLFN